MAFNPKILDGTLWLAEPGYIRRAAMRLAAIPTCPTARELVEARRQRLEVARQAATNAIRAGKGRVGVVPVYGPIDQRTNAMLEKLGGTSTEEIGIAIDYLVADPAVSAIVLHIDSPGGSSYGVSELSDKIYAARQSKRIYAMSDSMAASAAYWIATAASQIIVTPGGDVGSVGVYAAHVDESKALEEEGLTVTLVSAGKYKTEFASTVPLSAEARANLQSQVDATYGKFLAAIKRNRGVTMDQARNDFGQGRVVNADQAVSMGMADRSMSMDDLMAKLTGGAAPGGAAKVSAEVLRLRHERQKAASI